MYIYTYTYNYCVLYNIYLMYIRAVANLTTCNYIVVPTSKGSGQLPGIHLSFS